MEIDKKGQLYIGRESEGGDPVLLKASTLTTHGVIFGMTGSGKTGLGVNMLEEASARWDAHAHPRSEGRYGQYPAQLPR